MAVAEARWGEMQRRRAAGEELVEAGGWMMAGGFGIG